MPTWLPLRPTSPRSNRRIILIGKLRCNMARLKGSTGPETVERVAGNGLLHRRALLGRGAVLAGVLGAEAALRGTAAAADPLAEQDWSLATGDPVPTYQTPSQFAKNVVRTLSNPNFEPRTSQSRTPHQLLDGMITPNGVFFTIIHDGIA